MDGLLERIQENRLDALYLFINEGLRDPVTFDRFFSDLLAALPSNWSIARVELGHEFLGMVSSAVQQDRLFELVAGLDSLRTLIVSDGYVQRKDRGSIKTRALLNRLPNARNLTTLDLQRLSLEDASEVELLAEVLETMDDSLEEVRLSGLFVAPKAGTLDPVLSACVGMANLRSLALSTVVPQAHTAANDRRRFFSRAALRTLCLESTTLQDLTLRAMHVDDAQCQTIASALTTNAFLTSLDIRQNPLVTTEGYTAILEALQRNYELWCSVLVDDDTFQHQFNALIELNQAGRGDLLRSELTPTKLAIFLEKLKDDPTSIWYFLRIHETVREPLVQFLQWKAHHVAGTAAAAAAISGGRASLTGNNGSSNEAPTAPTAAAASAPPATTMTTTTTTTAAAASRRRKLSDEDSDDSDDSSIDHDELRAAMAAAGAASADSCGGSKKRKI